METEASRGAPPRRPPGRPRRFETEEILDAALGLFWERGFEATTTRQLERGLELSQSSLYNAFGSKRELLEAALDRYQALTDSALLQPLEQSPEGLKAIDAFVVALGQWVTQGRLRGCMLTNVMAEDGGVTDAVTRRTRGYRARVREALRRGLERAAALGEIADESLDERAELLLGLVLGLNIAARGGAGREELDRLIGAIRALVRGFALES